MNKAEQDYRNSAGDPADNTEKAQVSFWKDRISRAIRELHLIDREKAAESAYEYIDGKKAVANKKVYLDYLLPLLEEMHRHSLPGIPLATIEGKSDAAELVADKCRSWLDSLFNSPQSNYQEKLDELQWDDSMWAGGIAKVTWFADIHEQTSEDITTDEALLASETERAMAENDDPISAHLVESDNDVVHAMVHEQALPAYEIGTPEYDSLSAHIDEHKQKGQMVVSERPVLDCVAPDRFVFDPDVSWEKRSWESELRRIRIQDMVEWGWKNLNTENCPAERESSSDKVRYEDMTALVWDIHDIDNNRRFVISHRGPDEGLFLHKGEWKYTGIDIYRPFYTRKTKRAKSFGVSTAAQCLPILEELAIVDYHIQKHVKDHADYHWRYPKGSLSTDDKGELNDPNRKIREVSAEALALGKEFKPPPIPETLLKHRDTLLGELRRIVGVDAQDMSVEHAGGTITATESMRRSSQGDSRKNHRQEIVGRIISWIGYTSLRLFKRFGTMAVSVREVTPIGSVYQPLSPEDVPSDLDVSFDIKGESDANRDRDLMRSREYADFLVASQQPTDMDELTMWLGRKYGVKHPEKFRLPMGMEGPENQVEVPGQQMAGNIG